MSKRRKRTPWQITSEVAPTERTNAQRLDDMLQFAMEMMAWAGKLPGNARDVAVTRDATIYKLGIIGVAAAGMTEAFRAARPSIPWERVIVMQEFLGKPDRLLDHAAVERAKYNLIPVLLKELTKLKSSRRS